MDMLDLQLLNCVATHDFIPDLVLALAHHQRLVLAVRVPLISKCFVAVHLPLHRLLDGLSFFEGELAQRAKRPGVIHSDVFQGVIRS